MEWVLEFPSWEMLGEFLSQEKTGEKDSLEQTGEFDLLARILNMRTEDLQSVPVGHNRWVR